MWINGRLTLILILTPVLTLILTPILILTPVLLLYSMPKFIHTLILKCKYKCRSKHKCKQLSIVWAGVSVGISKD